MNFELTYRIKTYIQKHLFNLMYRKSFNFFGKKSYVISPLRILGSEYISIGNNVTVGPYTWFGVIKQEKTPKFVIKDGVYIGNFCHFDCIDEIIIGENTMFADKVYVGDNSHGYEDYNIPISKQNLIYKGKVSIGKNCWIGENVSILSAKIGNNCVIGAGSVVTKEIPDNSIAVGNPAKIIKKIGVDK